jgi:methanogenic corrinoid protein MtbC1
VVDGGAYRNYVSALVEGDRRACAAILDGQLQIGAPLRTIYIDLIQSSLYEIGDRWERTELSVVTEHVASAITETLLNHVFASMEPAPRVGRSVVVAAFAPEMHRIGARIVADLFELTGWDTRFVGADTPSGQLREALEARTPDLVALSLTNPALRELFVQKLAELRRACPRLEVIVGGQALRNVGPSLAQRDPRLAYFRSVEELFLSEKVGAAQPTRRQVPVELS